MTKALYVHVPFCAHICYYCDFCHSIYQKDRAHRWLEAFKREFKERVDDEVSTIYIGGGTPTALDDDLLEELLKTLACVHDPDKEYTIEINPETLNAKKVELLKRYGINRASIGMISSNDKELASLGRRHSFSDVTRTVELLKRYGIDNYSLDILYSFPGETFENYKKTIAEALALRPKHLSLYSLTIEEGTLFYKRGVEHFDEDEEADYYEYAKKTFEENGLLQYEVSNFALKGYESKHNLVYWHYEDFIGLSMGASGKIGAMRYDNTRDLIEYEKGHYIKERLDLRKEDMMYEYLMMGLRLNDGISLSDFEKRFDISVFEAYKKTLPSLLESGSVKVIDGHLIASDLEILNTILVDLLDQDSE